MPSMVAQVRLHHAVYALSNVAWCIENFDPGSNEVLGGLKWVARALVAAIGVCRFDVSSARACRFRKCRRRFRHSLRGYEGHTRAGCSQRRATPLTQECHPVFIRLSDDRDPH